ncbi:MAG: trypsin-like peptidase domain-containing protein [Clostridia bacterium]|nr:trypsin-like peptidase domain-containing protein [Clostridia bacterium]
MKKCISVLLATIMMLSSGFVVSANTNGSMENFKSSKTYTTGQFVDVSNSDWYAENVKMAYELSLVNGTSDTTFSPNSNLTIAEAITLASRMNNIYYGNTYSFVPGDVWYQTYVDYAIKNGIIKNNEYSNFDALATRYQFAEIFSSALPDDALQVINQVADNSIPDVPLQSTYSDAVYKLYRAGILTGNDANGTFAPNTNIQRSAVAAIVSRMANAGLRQSINLIADKNQEIKEFDKILTTEEISQKCSPAVFYIEVYGFNGKVSGSGSGFFISPDGVAITNYHVVADSIYSKITTTDGKTYEDISIIDYDKENDLALLKIDGSNFSYLEMGDSVRIKQGQRVYAIGSPLGLSNTMSQGIISNVSRILDDVEYIQISVPINHGSSGGALIDEYGNVIAVTSAGFNTTGDLNLAIPINKAKILKRDSTASYFVWSETCYPGFSQVLDFEIFSGVQLISSYDTMISYDEEYDIYDFHDIGPYDAGTCYGYTMVYYEKALEDRGMTKTQISDKEVEFESDSEIVSIKHDFDLGKIFISALKKPVFYDEFPVLIDFGWYSNMSMADIPQRIDASILYSYEWSAYYYQSDYENVLYSYFDLLQEIGYKYIATEKMDSGSTCYLFEGNKLSVVFICSDTEMFIDVCKI